MIVEWTATALRDLSNIRAYIAQRNPTAAEGIARSIRRAVEGLGDYPAMGRPGKRPDTRELVVAGTPYIVIYTVSSGSLQIITVIHGARDRT